MDKGLWRGKIECPIKLPGSRALYQKAILGIAGGAGAVLLLVGVALGRPGKGTSVYASDKQETRSQNLPSGIAGVVSGVSNSHTHGSQVKRIGTSCENVLVGQRVKSISQMGDFDLSSALADSVDALYQRANSLVAGGSRLMSDSDYSTLLKIVEAEAGEDDVKGRVLVANVIMNRMKRPDFPNTVTDVVFQYVNGVPQFSPVYFGTIYDVTVTEETREAVRQALSGVDYSEGALFFIQKSAADKSSVTWFDTDLQWLFKHGVHEFYTYKPETDPLNAENQVLTASVNKTGDSSLS